MDTISIECPQCHVRNTVPKPPATGGHVVCTDCRHVFKVVPKKKSTAAPSLPREEHVPEDKIVQETGHEERFAGPAATALHPGLSTLLKSVGAGPAMPFSIPAVLDDASAGGDRTSGRAGTVNNLVFTVLPAQDYDKDRIDMPLLLSDAIEKTDEISAHQQMLQERQNTLHREFNWTLASLAALTVLIVQLFYLMVVR